MLSEITFEAVTIADFSEIYLIEKRAYSIPWSETVMKSMFGEQQFKLKVLYNDSIVGYIFVLIVMDEATILNIAVDPKYQGRGIGRALLQCVKKRLSDKLVVELFLEVRESNKKAIALYESEGFNAIDLRKDYYPSSTGREHAIVMASSLLG